MTKLWLCISLALAFLHCGVFLREVSAKHKHSCSGPAPKNITVFNYLSIQGPNSTSGYNAVQCGEPLKTQPNLFGNQFCFDMPLLAAQDLNSTLLGIIQGTYFFASLIEPGASLYVSETFTLNTTATPQGTFSAAGLEQIGNVTEKPITGGTGAFAFLVGVATTTPLSNGVDANGNLVSFFKYDFTFRSTACT